MNPQIVRAFRAEGTPSGIGEIQVSFYDTYGIEKMAAAEVTDELAADHVIMRSIGGGQFPPRVGFFLTDTVAGTLLELRFKLVPRWRAQATRELVADYESGAQIILKRVKTVAESRSGTEPPLGLQAWNESQPF